MKLCLSTPLYLFPIRWNSAIPLICLKITCIDLSTFMPFNNYLGNKTALVIVWPRMRSRGPPFTRLYDPVVWRDLRCVDAKHSVEYCRRVTAMDTIISSNIIGPDTNVPLSISVKHRRLQSFLWIGPFCCTMEPGYKTDLTVCKCHWPPMFQPLQ